MESYISPKIKLGKSKIGKGLFATGKISKDEVVIDFTNGPGKFLSTKEADELYEKGNDYMIQVDEDLFFVATSGEELENADFVNHSCNPNCGLRGSLQIAAMKDIKAGEEITIDYAMCESSDYQIQCECGAKNCRGIITGDDWKIPALQQRYAGFFSEYLQKRIKK